MQLSSWQDSEADLVQSVGDETGEIGMRAQSHSVEVHTVPRRLSYLGKMDTGFLSCQLWGEHAKLYGLLPHPYLATPP